jgi:glycosyltransferase involved in cell wall biosynthesis
LPPVEAMASGTPVVATRSGAIVETVDDGATGLWVDKNDSKALAEALLRLLQNDDLREEMGRAARRRILGQFTWEKVAERMFIRYAALCGLSLEATGATTPIAHK